MTLIHAFAFDSLLNLTGSYDRTDTLITFDTTITTAIYRLSAIGVTNIINIEGSTTVYGYDFYGIYEQDEYFPVEGDTAVFNFTF